MNRRTLITAALAGLFGAQHLPGFILPAAAQDAPAGTPFTFDTAISLARTAAGKPYSRALMRMAPPFADLKYDAYRGIRTRSDHRLFADGNSTFQMELLPPGSRFQDRLEINLVGPSGVAQPIAFSPEFFDFQPEYFPFPDGPPTTVEGDMSFSGVRFRAPMNRPGVWDEILVFQGASYFRAVAHDTLFGLSARGLAIGTAGPVPEEFPVFTTFWIFEPQPGERTLHLCALLDSELVTGAFEFRVTPGFDTRMDVSVVLFPRREIATVGMAPLTSMYFFGPESRADIDDFRNAVHDSDGLRMVNGSGERLWRPLRNPPRVETSAFRDQNPRAFGLIQRARTFGDYSDAEARYEVRPSAWVEPTGDWGAGSVMLVEIPSADEFTDNIVAFWRPDAPLAAGSEVRYGYRLTFGKVQPEDQPLARIAATRSGLSILDPRERVYVVDFDLGMIDYEDVDPRLEVSAGETKGLSIQKLPNENVARIGFHFLPGEQPAAEFRLWLESNGKEASEVWLHRWSV